MTLIYKILAADEWAAARSAGRFDGSAVDLADGYIHFSTAAQAADTARKHFPGREGLVIVAFEAEALGPALRWEPARGGALFPHLYGPLDPALAVWTRAAPLSVDGVPDVGSLS